MKRPSDLDSELLTALSCLLVAGPGWLIHSAPLVIVGLLGAATTFAFYLWQRNCLVGVRFNQHLSAERATFGELVTLEVDVVNDKVLPLTWLRIDDEVPSMITIEGGTIADDRSLVDRLVQLFPLLPYQRVRRQFTIVCNGRGEHSFGPATITSGDPLGLRTQTFRTHEREHLLVYPKVFTLAPAGLASRVLIGDARSHSELVEDPSRVSGVREYRPGDPLRNVDWRATARSGDLLVRQFEPSVALRVALFLDCRVIVGRPSLSSPELEYAIAIAASILSELAERRVTTGLYSTGQVLGRPIALPPSAAPSALATMLESLARASALASTDFSDLLGAHAPQLRQGTSVAVVATDFPESTLVALQELRRRHGVTAVFIDTGTGSPPPAGVVDRLLTTEFSNDWHERTIVELAS